MFVNRKRNLHSLSLVCVTNNTVTMYLVGTAQRKYTVYGYDVFNSLAAVELFGVDYRVGLERERASALLIMQSPTLYIIPFGLNFRAYITRLANLVTAFVESFTGPDSASASQNGASSTQNIPATIWDLIKGYMHRADPQTQTGDPRRLIQEKVQLYTQALENNLMQINDQFLVNRFARFDKSWFDMLKVALNGLSKHFPVFLLESSELIVRDGIMNTLAETALERALDQLPEIIGQQFLNLLSYVGLGKVASRLTGRGATITTLLAQALNMFFGGSSTGKESNQNTAIYQEGGTRIIVNVNQETQTVIGSEVNVQQSNIQSNQNDTQQSGWESVLASLAQLMVAKRVDMPRRWDDVQRTLQIQVTITLSANNLFEYITNVMAPILYLQMLASPTQEAGGIGRIFMETPPGVTVLIPGKVLIPFAIIDSFQYQLDPINQANTGHSLNATVTISFTDLVGAFVAPRSSIEGAEITGSTLFNPVTSAIIGSLYRDPVKEVLYRANDWISKTDETKYDPVKRLLFGDNLFYSNKGQQSTQTAPQTEREKMLQIYSKPDIPNIPPEQRLTVKTDIPSRLTRMRDIISKGQIILNKPAKPGAPIEQLMQDGRYLYDILTQLKTEQEQMLNEILTLKKDASALLAKLPPNSPEYRKVKYFHDQLVTREVEVRQSLNAINTALNELNRKVINVNEKDLSDPTKAKGIRYGMNSAIQKDVRHAIEYTKAVTDRITATLKLINTLPKDANIKTAMQNKK